MAEVAYRDDLKVLFTEMRTTFVLAPNNDFRYGACIYKPLKNGWVFIPNVNNRRPSRRVYDTAEAAIPRWAKPYRLQSADQLSDSEP